MTTKNIPFFNSFDSPAEPFTPDSRALFDAHQNTLWAQCAADYAAGCRDKDTVLPWIVRKASMQVAKKFPGWDFAMELQSAGYAEAVEKWKDKYYDPEKDRGNGREAYVYKCVRGVMLNAAKQMTNRLNKRNYKPGDTCFSYDESTNGDLVSAELSGYGPNGVTAAASTEDLTETDRRTDTAAGGGNTKILVADPDRQNGNPLLRGWTTETRQPPGSNTSPPVTKYSRNTGTPRSTQEAAEVSLWNLFERYQAAERDVLMAIFGVLGRSRETIQQIAARTGYTYTYVARIVDGFKAEHKVQEHLLPEDSFNEEFPPVTTLHVPAQPASHHRTASPTPSAPLTFTKRRQPNVSFPRGALSTKRPAVLPALTIVQANT